LREVLSYESLDYDYEAKLLRLVAQGDQAARDILIKANLKFVVFIAKAYAKIDTAQYYDLVSEGNIGLMFAVDNFDPAKGYFRIYLKRVIISKMLRFISSSKEVRIPVYIPEWILPAWIREKTRMETQFGRMVTDEEVSDSLKLSENVRNGIKFLRGQHVPMDPMLKISRPDQDPVEELAINELLEIAYAELRKMDEKTKTIMRKRYGFVGMKPKTKREIGEEMNISKQRVHQLEQEALRRLSKVLFGMSRNGANGKHKKNVNGNGNNDNHHNAITRKIVRTLMVGE
jgi:RNA polymerase primary sigma factor